MHMRQLLRAINGVQRQLTRDYAFKSDLKIKWVRPEKPSCTSTERSGDCSKLPKINETEYIRVYKDSKELASADPLVQSLFQLNNNRNYLTTNHYRHMLVNEVQRHPLDYGSMEAKLAYMTAGIRRFQEHLEKFPRDKRLKIKCKEMIEKRKKFLKHLRRWDYRRFEWILEKLDLIYKPHPPKYHRITRKESLVKLTDIHCENIKQERLDVYRQLLEAQQIPFLKDAIKNMEFVRKEQIDLEIPVTVTEEQINSMKAELTELEKVAAEKAEIKEKIDEDKIY